MKITPGFFLVCIFCGLFFVLARRREGVGSRRINLYPSVGEGPYFESARGLLGRSWELKGWIVVFTNWFCYRSRYGIDPT
jgi:hypothetical protein